MIEIPDLSVPFNFLIATLIVFGVVMGRYVVIAGIFHAVFYIWYPETFRQRKISQRDYRKSQFRREFGWSVVTSLIFAIAGAIMGLLWQKGILKVYTDINEYPLWWLPASFLIALFLHETYYYWLHRWMHHPKIFRYVHKVHHESNITSAWTAFSFHPFEGLLQALFLPALLLIMPMHLYVLLIQLTFMTLSSVINHLDIEIYPGFFHRTAVGRLLIGASHHSLHHKEFRTNYGLYFTFWDKWKKTESVNYERLFREKTQIRSQKSKVKNQKFNPSP
jgi:Delta7-sterol 5-desaturase